MLLALLSLRRGGGGGRFEARNSSQFADKQELKFTLWPTLWTTEQNQNCASSSKLTFLLSKAEKYFQCTLGTLYIIGHGRVG